MKNKAIAMIATALVTATGMAKVEVPTFIASDMVMQQNAVFPLRGKASAGSKVRINASWNADKNTLVTEADGSGNWNVKLATPEAGGPYSIVIDDGDEPLTLDNVMIGEVWLCSGQSNMEMPMGGFDGQPVEGGTDVIARAKRSVPVRVYNADNDKGRWVRQWSQTPRDTMWGRWYDNAPENVRDMSATAYYFARYLNEVLEVPVGVMVSSLGGSRIESWMSREACEGIDGVDMRLLELDSAETDKRQRNVPGVLYNAKINPLKGIPMAGMLWYQGESNVGDDNYAVKMEAMVRDLRNKWGQGEWPFYFVEISPFNYDGGDGISAALLREQQQKARGMIPHSGMVSVIDHGHPTMIHPMNKKVVGERLAWLALGDAYGRRGHGEPSPIYRDMEVKDGVAFITVDNASRGLCPMWCALDGFEIAGADMVWHEATADLHTYGGRLAVRSDEVPEPVAVRYAFKNYPKVSVYNIHGLPLMPFRTDGGY